MGKREISLVVVALLIGIGGAALGAYSVFFLPKTIVQQADDYTVVSQIWTVEQGPVYYPGGSYAEVPDMDLNITVNANETVYVTFSGQFDVLNTTWLYGCIRIMIDNVPIDISRRIVNVESSFGWVGSDIQTACIIEDLAAGEYIIELQALGQVGEGSLRLTCGLLTIFTYK